MASTSSAPTSVTLPVRLQVGGCGQVHIGDLDVPLRAMDGGTVDLDDRVVLDNLVELLDNAGAVLRARRP